MVVSDGSATDEFPSSLKKFWKALSGPASTLGVEGYEWVLYVGGKGGPLVFILCTAQVGVAYSDVQLPCDKVVCDVVFQAFLPLT